MEPTSADDHRRLAIEANNSAWELLDGRSLSTDEADDLLGRVYSALHHWRRAAKTTPANACRASWLVSRAHAVLGHGELALHHAERAGERLDDASTADFDVAYSHEAAARALACLGRRHEARTRYDQAVSVPIADDQDREIFLGDLAAEPWFDLERPEPG